MNKQDYLKEIRDLCEKITKSEDLNEIAHDIHILSEIKTNFMHKLSGYNQVKSCLTWDAFVKIMKWKLHEGYDEDGRGQITTDIVFIIDGVKIKLYIELNPDWRGQMYINLKINKIIHEEETECWSKLNNKSLLELVKRADLGELQEKIYKFLIKFLNSFDQYFEIEELGIEED